MVEFKHITVPEDGVFPYEKMLRHDLRLVSKLMNTKRGEDESEAGLGLYTEGVSNWALLMAQNSFSSGCIPKERILRIRLPVTGCRWLDYMPLQAGSVQARTILRSPLSRCCFPFRVSVKEPSSRVFGIYFL